MLIQFSAENFRSIKERATLSLVAGRGERGLACNCSAPPGAGGLKLLKSAAIFGANASGKSNLLRSMCALASLVRGSGAAFGRPIPIVPFALDPDSAARPSIFEATLLLDGAVYTYGLAAGAKGIRAEWLRERRGGRVHLLFEHEASRGQGRIRGGPEWEAFRDGAEHRLPLLARAARRKHPVAAKIAGWFEKRIQHIESFTALQNELRQTAEMARGDREMRGLFQKYLGQADLGIAEIKVGGAKSRVPERRRSRIPAPPRVRAVHVGKGASRVALDMFECESEGTRKLFALSGPWSRALKEGSLLLVDELDVRLHPLLTRMLIQMFHSEKNADGAQLVFTTHDSSLLGPDPLLRRDQIWFAEKSPEGSTRLFSLADFKPRRAENIRAAYLAGHYGGIPIIGWPEP